MLLVALISFLARVLIGFAVAALAATVFALLSDVRAWPEQFGIACLGVAALAVLMAFGGHSPSMRLGLKDHDFASLFPGHRTSYRLRVFDDAGERLRDFVLVGVALVVVGFALV